VLVATGVMVVNQVGRAQQMQDERDAAEQSAWQNHTELNQVLADTLTHLGLTGEAKDVPGSPLACVRNDRLGRDPLRSHRRPSRDQLNAGVVRSAQVRGRASSPCPLARPDLQCCGVVTTPH